MSNDDNDIEINKAERIHQEKLSSIVKDASIQISKCRAEVDMLQRQLESRNKAFSQTQKKLEDEKKLLLEEIEGVRHYYNTKQEKSRKEFSLELDNLKNLLNKEQKNYCVLKFNSETIQNELKKEYDQNIAAMQEKYRSLEADHKVTISKAEHIHKADLDNADMAHQKAMECLRAQLLKENNREIMNIKQTHETELNAQKLHLQIENQFKMRSMKESYESKGRREEIYFTTIINELTDKNNKLERTSLMQQEQLKHREKAITESEVHVRALKQNHEQMALEMNAKLNSLTLEIQLKNKDKEDYEKKIKHLEHNVSFVNMYLVLLKTIKFIFS